MGMKAQLARNATTGLLLIGAVSTDPGSGDTTVNGVGDGSTDRFKTFVNTHGFSAYPGWKHDEQGRVTVDDSADDVLDNRTY
jgi:hypothetical protein